MGHIRVPCLSNGPDDTGTTQPSCRREQTQLPWPSKTSLRKVLHAVFRAATCTERGWRGPRSPCAACARPAHSSGTRQRGSAWHHRPCRCALWCQALALGSALQLAQPCLTHAPLGIYPFLSISSLCSALVRIHGWPRGTLLPRCILRGQLQSSQFLNAGRVSMTAFWRLHINDSGDPTFCRLATQPPRMTGHRAPA